LTVSPPLSAQWRHGASLPLPSAQACSEKIDAHQGNNTRDNGRRRTEQRKASHLSVLLLFCGRHEGRRGEEERLLLSEGAQLLSLLPLLLFPFTPLPELPL
jgi:hypothetical protein